ncbi:MAG: iron-sulfur cluster insertion protein ErpA [Opitutaceae bacterium]|nr:iron-sulfur cluster insertion protein ErpA [Opitutaceae bacterium]
MISLTQKAAKQIKVLQDEIGDAEKRLRVLVESGGCSGFQYGMSFNVRKPDDVVVESHGMEVLVDPTSMAYLEGSEVDFDDGLQGKGFEIRNPNAESTCGCGKSFN